MGHSPAHTDSDHELHRPGPNTIPAFSRGVPTPYTHRSMPTCGTNTSIIPHHATQSLRVGGTYPIGLFQASCYWCSTWLDVAHRALQSTATRKTTTVVRAIGHGNFGKMGGGCLETSALRRYSCAGLMLYSKIAMILLLLVGSGRISNLWRKGRGITRMTCVDRWKRTSTDSPLSRVGTKCHVYV